jgi:hypothetical protein
MYGGVAALGAVWLYFVLPETKGLSLEEIEQLFQDGPAGYDQVESDEDEVEPQDEEVSLATMEPS